jgi:alpha-galactosidase
VRQSDDELVLAKPMVDGSLAVGLFNWREVEAEVAVSFAELDLKGAQQARDLWRQRDTGSLEERLVAKVPRHGVHLVRLRGD